MRYSVSDIGTNIFFFKSGPGAESTIFDIFICNATIYGTPIDETLTTSDAI